MSVSASLLPGCPADLQVYLLENDTLRLALLPAAGGRLIGAAVDGRELLWRNPAIFADGLRPRPRHEWTVSDGTLATWANPGGSKVWPAPEGSGPDEWPGPPEPVLEAGTWSVMGPPDGGGLGPDFTMVSPPDAGTGLQITRRIHLPDAGASVVEEVEFANIGDRPVRWAMWQVCQVATTTPGHDGRGEVELDVEPGTRPEVRGLSIGEPAVTSPSGTRLRISVTDFIGKLAFPGALGDLCYRAADGARVRLGIDVAPDAEYPHGSRADLWFQRPTEHGLGPDFRYLHPRDHYVELERYSPLLTIAPGSSERQVFTWAFAGPDHIEEVD